MPSDTDSPEPLRPIGVFKTLDADELTILARYGRSFEVEAGERIISENSTHDGFYVVISGRLRAFRRADGFETPLSEVGPGDPLGEMSFLDEQTASATVQATSGAVVWQMSSPDFDRFSAGHPATGAKLLRALGATVVRRLRRAMTRFSDQGQAVWEGWW